MEQVILQKSMYLFLLSDLVDQTSLVIQCFRAEIQLHYCSAMVNSAQSLPRPFSHLVTYSLLSVKHIPDTFTEDSTRGAN